MTSVDAPIRAAMAGTYLTIDDDNAYGKVLALDHGNGLQTHYKLLNGFAETADIGGSVAAGDIIGYAGKVNGTHGQLHFEVTVNGNRVNPFPNPSFSQTRGLDGLSTMLTSIATLAEYQDAYPQMPDYFDFSIAKVDQHLRDNATYFQTLGDELTMGVLYLSYAFGPQNLAALISADDNAKIEDVLSFEMLASNPFLHDYTVSQVKHWANSKAAMLTMTMTTDLEIPALGQTITWTPDCHG